MNKQTMYDAGDRVVIDGLWCGEVVGHGHMDRGDGHITNVYLVKLDIGRWSENREFFTSVTVVHPDNLEFQAATRFSRA